MKSGLSLIGVSMLLSCCALALSLVQAAEPAARRTLVLATVEDSTPAMHTDGKNVLMPRPGYRAELLQRAASRCQATVTFELSPWQRALYLVEKGEIDGAFVASYTAERAAYAVYPMKNGMPDPSKAIKGYTYDLFVRADSDVTWDGKQIGAADRHVLVERGAVGANVAKNFGMEPIEIAGTDKMLQMLMEKRASGIVGIDLNISTALKMRPEFAAKIKELTPPLEAKMGYVIFGKQFYARQKELVDCFWNAAGEIRASPEFNELVKSYTNGQPAE